MAEGSWKRSLIAAMSFFVAINTLVMATRLYVRIKLVNALGWDDGFLVAAYLGFVTACSMGFVSFHYGFAADSGEDHPWFDPQKALTYYWTNQLMLYISSGVVKIAVALVLYRLAANVYNRAILATSIVICVIWTFVTTVFSTDLCASNGSANYGGTGTCNSFGYFRMISNIFIDYFFAIYPIPLLWNSGLNERMKIIVCGLLALGVIASSATIAKLVILVKLETATGVELQNLHYQLLMWADVELGLAILTASAAALRPILRCCFSSCDTTAPAQSTVERQPTHGSVTHQPLSSMNNSPKHGQLRGEASFSRSQATTEVEMSSLGSKDFAGPNDDERSILAPRRVPIRIG